MEEWRPVKNFEGWYEVSNLGDVRSKFKMLTPSLNKQGYARVRLSKCNISHLHSVHTLVAEAFLDNPHNYKEVRPKDNMRAHNAATNLEWIVSGSSKSNRKRKPTLWCVLKTK